MTPLGYDYKFMNDLSDNW